MYAFYTKEGEIIMIDRVGVLEKIFHSYFAYNAKLINKIAKKEHKRYFRNMGYKNFFIVSQKKLIYDFFSENEKALLIVMDGCRFDYFIKYIGIIQEFKLNNLIPAMSHGSCTIEWLRKTFQKPLKNVLYISANPWVWKMRNNFTKVIKLWDFGWDKNIDTVLARTVNEAIKVVFDEGASKVIAHYLQPHSPFVKGSKLNIIYENSDKRSAGNMAYKRASRNPKARKEFIRAYNENVSYIIKELAKLIEYFYSKKEKLSIVITSDHGECLGRSGFINHLGGLSRKDIPWIFSTKIVGHPCNRKFPELIYVPWMKINMP